MPPRNNTETNVQKVDPELSTIHKVVRWGELHPENFERRASITSIADSSTVASIVESRPNSVSSDATVAGSFIYGGNETGTRAIYFDMDSASMFGREVATQLDRGVATRCQVAAEQVGPDELPRFVVCAGMCEATSADKRSHIPQDASGFYAPPVGKGEEPEFTLVISDGVTGYNPKTGEILGEKSAVIAAKIVRYILEEQKKSSVIKNSTSTAGECTDKLTLAFTEARRRARDETDPADLERSEATLQAYFFKRTPEGWLATYINRGPGNKDLGQQSFASLNSADGKIGAQEFMKFTGTDEYSLTGDAFRVGQYIVPFGSLFAATTDGFNKIPELKKEDGTFSNTKAFKAIFSFVSGIRSRMTSRAAQKPENAEKDPEPQFLNFLRYLKTAQNDDLTLDLVALW